MTNTKVLVLVLNKTRDLCEPLRRAGMEATALCPPQRSLAAKLRWSLQVLTMDMSEFDVVISQGGVGFGLAATLAARAHGCLAVSRFRGDPWQEYDSQVRRGKKSRLEAAIYSWAEKRNLDLVDLILPISEPLAQWIDERSGCGRDRMAVVSIPVDCSRYRCPDTLPRPPEWDYPCLIALATLFQFHQKIAGLEQALPLLRAVVEKYEAGVVIAGDGPLRDSFMRKHAELLDHPSIHLPGYIDDMAALYQWTDIFCHFSLLDSLGAVLLQAWCCELPVVVNDYEPLLEHVQHGINGYVISNDADFDESMSAFDRLITDPAHRRELGRKGKDLVDTKFTAEAVGCQLREAIEQALRRSAR